MERGATTWRRAGSPRRATPWARAVLAGLTAFALVAAGRAAFAQGTAPAPWSPDGADDVVVLRDGSTLAGRAIDVRRGDQVTLRLPGGALRVVLWSDVRSARGPAFDPVKPSAEAIAESNRPAGSTYDGPSLLEPRPGAVPVHVLSTGEPLVISGVRESWLARDAAAELELASLGAASWNAMGEVPGQAGMRDPFNVGVHLRRLCTTPCVLYLAPGPSVLHVGGPGRIESLQRVTIARSGQLVVFHSGSSAVFAAGAVIAVGGGIVGALGALALLLSAAAPPPPGALATDASLPVLGFVSLGTAALALAAGIPMMAAAHAGVARTAPLGVDARGGAPGSIAF